MQEGYFSLPDANFPSSRAQNRDFCVRTGNFPLVFAPPEHKIGIFVRFLPSEPSFSGFLSTKSAFLCQNWQFSLGFYPFRAQNRHFCALFAFGTTIFWPFEHKIGIFVRFLTSGPLFSGVPSIKSGFCALIQGNIASGSRKARKFFLHAFKLLLPVGNCRQSTWNRGT